VLITKSVQYTGENTFLQMDDFQGFGVLASSQIRDQPSKRILIYELHNAGSNVFEKMLFCFRRMACLLSSVAIH